MRTSFPRPGFLRICAALVLSVLGLAGCAGLNQNGSEPLPTVVLDSGNIEPSAADQPVRIATGEGVTASGVVVAAHEVRLAFAVGGLVRTVDIAEGDSVQAGQILANLDTAEAQLAVEQAAAALQAAQVRYDMTEATADTQRKAQVAAAQLALKEAQNAIDQLERDAPLAAAQAQVAVSNAVDALAEAQRKRTNMNYPRANQTTIDGAQAFYDLKEIELEDAKKAYNGVKNRDADDPVRARALLDLTNAQNERDRALITLNWYLGKNSEEDLAQADAELALAQAQLDAAQQRWDEVKDGPAPAELALVQARLANAQAQLDLASIQSIEDELALAQGQVDTARLNLELAQSQERKLAVTAPFAGVVAELDIEPGAWVLPGQVFGVLVDLEQLQVRTTDLSERDLPSIAVDEPVKVTIKALNQDVTGRVQEISPLAETLGGDIVYPTIIDLDVLPDGLRVGMSVEVQFASRP